MTFYIGLGIGIFLGFFIIVILFAIVKELLNDRISKKHSHELHKNTAHKEHIDETPPSSIAH